MNLRLLVVPLAALLGTTSLLHAENEFDGTWALNTAKSKSTGGPTWKSRTLKLTSVGDTRKFQSDGESIEGKKLSGGYEAKTDGKDYPLTGHISGAETISLKQTSPRVMGFTLKKGGKVISRGQSTVSADGKTLTIAGKGTSDDGKPFTVTQVYDKK